MSQLDSNAEAWAWMLVLVFGGILSLLTPLWLTYFWHPWKRKRRKNGGTENSAESSYLNAYVSERMAGYWGLAPEVLAERIKKLSRESDNET